MKYFLYIMLFSLILTFGVIIDKLRKRERDKMRDYQIEINDGYHYTLFDNGRVVARFDTLSVPFLDSIIYKDNE